MDAMPNSEDFNPADLPDYPELDETGQVDLSLIDCILDCTPAQRIARFGGVLEVMELARQARIKQYGYDPAADRSPETPE